MSKRVLQFHTLNSTYEIDFEESAVRRVSGRNANLFPLPNDGEWHTFVELKKIGSGGYPAQAGEPFCYWFAFPKGDWLRTSLVQEQADMEYEL